MQRSALRKLKAVLHRRRLAEGLPDLEGELMALVLSGSDRLGGYRLKIECGRLLIEKLPKRDGKQLELSLVWRSAELCLSASSAELRKECDCDGGKIKNRTMLK